MWTDLFKPAGSHARAPGVECVDCVDPRNAAPVGTPLLIRVSPPPGVAASELPPHAAMPTTSASNESTQSTQSTPGKFCRLLTAAQKNAFLALFEQDLDLVEMETRAAGHDTANELRRVINVVWRLITVEELDFDTATTKAVEWVVAQPMHPDELIFADVLSFSRGHDEK